MYVTAYAASGNYPGAYKNETINERGVWNPSIQPPYLGALAVVDCCVRALAENNAPSDSSKLRKAVFHSEGYYRAASIRRCRVFFS